MPETEQRFQFRLRHLWLIVTVLCALLAVAVAIPWLAFPIAFVFVVGSATARISTRRPELGIIGPIFAVLGGFVGILLSIFLLDVAHFSLHVRPTPLVGFCLFFPPMFGVVFGGWCGGWLEHKHSSSVYRAIKPLPRRP